MKEFQSELASLIGKHSIDAKTGVPRDFLAELVCRLIESIVGPAKEIRIDWQGEDFVCGTKLLEDDTL